MDHLTIMSIIGKDIYLSRYISDIISQCGIYDMILYLRISKDIWYDIISHLWEFQHIISISFFKLIYLSKLDEKSKNRRGKSYIFPNKSRKLFEKNQDNLMQLCLGNYKPISLGTVSWSDNFFNYLKIFLRYFQVLKIWILIWYGYISKQLRQI